MLKRHEVDLRGHPNVSNEESTMASPHPQSPSASAAPRADENLSLHFSASGNGRAPFGVAGRA
jgi:hypothetical protein